MLKIRSFDAACLAPGQQQSAWGDFLAGLKAKAFGEVASERFAASFTSLSTTWGFAIVRLTMSAQHLSFDTRALSGGLWLMRVAKGNGTFRTERGNLAFEEGDLIFGKTSRDFRIAAACPTSIECVHFPRVHNGSRLVSIALPFVASKLAANQGNTAFLGDLLRLATARLEGLGIDEIRPLEITLIEFLMAAIATTSAAETVIEGSKVRNATALRATQAIELRLSDPDLSPSGVAEHLGISLRYLQKLFEDAGENANSYIRRRRLERSHQDLADPLYADLSIAEISYRWGFNDSAYFSRAFRERYGLSPSQHREQGRWKQEPPRRPKGGADFGSGQLWRLELGA